ncbi:D-glycero-alpha-D-manno-heptose-1,7-bisphosphate 7-phosphatase [Cuniculiplasma sp. SKW4]|uniref:D-glycero-alpha-D-manno-heptose-1,7-bisphosphate 7-phosphatase n=1 Tax=Cuniculiplasma sp. SKW4 TaxID=3400171 RepID=UPI003FD11EE9
MKNKALFVDRDGTINRDCPYCKDPSQIVLYDDAIDIMKDFQSKGYLIIIVTNQSGINRGYFTIEEFKKFQEALLEMLHKRGVNVLDTFYCPHRPDEKCKCRKPETGMIEDAAKKYHIDIGESIIMGDRDDMEGEIGRKLGMKYIILNRN